MYKITKNGVALDPELYTIDEANKTFASIENDLVLDFTGKDSWIFRIKGKCEIIAGNGCTIDADYSCNITTGNCAVIRVCDNSTITAGDRCNIDTHHNCTITTEDDCIINTWGNCTITTANGSSIYAGAQCNITTGHNAVIRAYGNSVITGGEGCAVIKRDTVEVIRLVAGQTIKLNGGYGVEGYEVVEPETIEIGGLKFNKEEVEKLLKNLKPII